MFQANTNTASGPGSGPHFAQNRYPASLTPAQRRLVNYPNHPIATAPQHRGGLQNSNSSNGGFLAPSSTRPMYAGQHSVGATYPPRPSPSATVTHQFDRLGLNCSNLESTQVPRASPPQGLVARPRTGSTQYIAPLQNMQNMGSSKAFPRNSQSMPTTPTQKSRRLCAKRPSTGGRNRSNTEPCINGAANNEEEIKAKRKLRKNDREKQRRCELNEKFKNLNQLLSLGRKTKAEKVTILSEAINTIKTLRAENHELRNDRNDARRRLDKMTEMMVQSNPDTLKIFKFQMPETHIQQPTTVTHLANTGEHQNGAYRNGKLGDSLNTTSSSSNNRVATKPPSTPAAAQMTAHNDLAHQHQRHSGSGASLSSSRGSTSGSRFRSSGSQEVGRRSQKTAAANDTSNSMMIDSGNGSGQSSGGSANSGSLVQANSCQITREESDENRLPPMPKGIAPPLECVDELRTSLDDGVGVLSKYVKEDFPSSRQTFSHGASIKKEPKVEQEDSPCMYPNTLFSSTCSVFSQSNDTDTKIKQEVSSDITHSRDGDELTFDMQSNDTCLPLSTSILEANTTSDLMEANSRSSRMPLDEELSDEDSGSSVDREDEEMGMIDAESQMLTVHEDKLPVVNVRDGGGSGVDTQTSQNLLFSFQDRSLSPFPSAKNPFGHEDEWPECSIYGSTEDLDVPFSSGAYH